MAWIRRCTPAWDVLTGVEATSSYGTWLTCILKGAIAGLSHRGNFATPKAIPMGRTQCPWSFTIGR